MKGAREGGQKNIPLPAQYIVESSVQSKTHKCLIPLTSDKTIQKQNKKCYPRLAKNNIFGII